GLFLEFGRVLLFRNPLHFSSLKSRWYPSALGRRNSGGSSVLSIDVGVRRPLGASVSGIVLLAGLDEEAAQRLTKSNATRLTLAGSSVAKVTKSVQSVREQGYIYAEEGVMQSTSAVAVPIRDPQGQVVAAISVAALSNRLSRKRVPAVVSAMQEHSSMITRRLAELEKARRHPSRTPSE
ncbi:IclR family transcriptional regulator domain-containing protein, partial [Azohydromonas aeria]|uniref:IclR family transcriptional regulator domain-containing protein n=1 Tax=Azohydromonas aeria TaxID=2590212 RepID=UPI002873173D